MIRVIVGPPAGGKNTYVAAHRGVDDVVVDQDTLVQALGGGHRQSSHGQRAVAYAARRAAVGKICGEGIGGDSWIIHGNPSPGQVEYYGAAGARFVVCAPPMEDVLARAGDDGRPPETEELIRKWYETPPLIPEAWIEQQSEGKAKPVRTKYAEALIKTEENGEDQGQFTAYASTFDREPDSYGDVVAKGAFAKTLKEWAESGNIIPVLFGHRMDDPDFNIGAVLHAEEDERGLKIVGQLDLDSPKGMKVYKLIKGRRLSQLSFAFDVLDEASVKLEDGTKANELRELKLYEVSLVPIGANQHTEILAVKDAVRALTESVKAGRVISAKNEETLQTVAASMKEAAAQIESVLAQVSGGEAKGEKQASTPTVAEQVSAAGGVSAAQQNTLKAALDIALALNQGN